MKRHCFEDGFMDEEEPTWVVVLLALYENGMAGESFDKYGYQELPRNKAIAEEVNRESAEVGRAIQELKRQNLVNGVPSGRESQGYTLTPDGFEVAYERDLKRQERRRERNRDKRQHEVNRAIGFLTVGLLVTGFLQAVISAQASHETGLLEMNFTLLIGGIVVVGIAGMLGYSGMLASWDRGSE